jgi:hypothetical protein
MDILIQDNIAHELFPDGAPELHSSLVIVKNYVGDVAEGWDWDGTTFTAPVAPIPTADEIRAQRDLLLAETDWAVLPDVTAPAGYLEYRQALRDITAQAGFPENVDWPIKP